MTRLTSLRSARWTMAVCLVGAAATASAAGSGQQKISKSEKTGPYTLRLEILPVEPFVSTEHSELKKFAGRMVNGRGAAPILKGGPQHPNHHMAVFVMRDGHIVENALIHVRYRKSGTKTVHELPVTVMWVAGKPRYKTQHFGNNVYLANAAYDVQVQLNHRKPLDYHIDLSNAQSGGQSSQVGGQKAESQSGQSRSSSSQSGQSQGAQSAGNQSQSAAQTKQPPQGSQTLKAGGERSGQSQGPQQSSGLSQSTQSQGAQGNNSQSQGAEPSSGQSSGAQQKNEPAAGGKQGPQSQGSQS